MMKNHSIFGKNGPFPTLALETGVAAADDPLSVLLQMRQNLAPRHASPVSLVCGVLGLLLVVVGAWDFWANPPATTRALSDPEWQDVRLPEPQVQPLKAAAPVKAELNFVTPQYELKPIDEPRPAVDSPRIAPAPAPSSPVHARQTLDAQRQPALLAREKCLLVLATRTCPASFRLFYEGAEAQMNMAAQGEAAGLTNAALTHLDGAGRLYQAALETLKAGGGQ